MQSSAVGGFHLYSGNDADALVERLAARLISRAQNPDEPGSSGIDLLAPQIILVPQFGLRRWLEIRLAERCGIIANVDFFAPAEYAWRLLRAARPELGETSLFERNILRWRIFSELAVLARDKRFAALTHALQDGSQATRWRLASELAHWFERYLAYRSDLLARWERGDDKDDWQAELWRHLTRAAAEPHRARLLGDYIRKFGQKFGDDAETIAPPGLPRRLFAFACTNISPDLLHFYNIVAQHCELDFFMPNPCREYWGDVRSERERLRTDGGDDPFETDNPLLAANGRTGRDFIAQLFSYEQVQPADEIDLSREPGHDTLLRRMQTDVLNLRDPEKAAIAADSANDRSLQFHRCHSRLREVQVLHDQLLDLFQRDATLTPRDVAVMAPDISAYAPYIEAVFGGVDRNDKRYLPYTISDGPAHDSHPLIALALKLAALPLSRMGLSEVIELLAVPAVMRKLDLDSQRIAELENWLRTAGVRWGADENQREVLGAGRYREFSWAFGLDRLLLGYASGACPGLIGGIAPDAQIEGASAQKLGSVLRALGALKALSRAQTAAHPARQWQEIYNAALDALIDVDNVDHDERRALERIRAALAVLAEQAAVAGTDEALDWQCVLGFLDENLREPERAYRFFSGGISVCGMVPLRAVPFRVVCLIGMNAEAFPRRDRASMLDRMQSAVHASSRRVPAARSDRDEDRYLFLQLFSVARDVFFLSWIGEEQRDGAPREPSAVVAELLDLVAGRYFTDESAARKYLLVEHPMQPFSPRNFSASDERIFTYRNEWRAAASRKPAAHDGSTGATDKIAHAQPVDSSETKIGTVEWDELRRFLRAPARKYLYDRLGIRLDSRAEQMDDEDSLQLDGLEMYTLREGLAAASLSDNAAAMQLPTLRAQGLLPVGQAAFSVAEVERQAAAALAEALHATGIDIHSEVKPFALAWDNGSELIGSLPRHRGREALRWSVGANNGKRLLDAWLAYLAFAASAAGDALIVLGVEKGVVDLQRFSGVGRDAAKAVQASLLEHRHGGARAPLLFFPKSSLAYVKHWQGNATAPAHERHAVALAAARQSFEGSNRAEGEAAREPAFALVARAGDLFQPETAAAREFARLALEIYAPLLEALSEQSV
jgi:exodeoxyribonuclease V gamma subunit